MSTPRDLPGFYFDAEKGKYFRIQPNHKAPAGAAHSQSAVNAKKRAERATEDARIRHDRVIRSVQRIGSGSYTKLNLDLRLGARPSRNATNLREMYAARLCFQSIDVERGSRIRALALSQKGSLYVTTRDTTNLVGLAEVYRPNTRPRSWSLARQVVPVSGGSHDQLAILDDTHFVSVDDGTLHIGSITSDDPVVVFRIGHINDMASSQRSGSLALAGQIRDENFVWYIKDIDRPTPWALRDLTREQVVVAFRDENVIMSGQRNGTINFTDHRFPTTVARLKHSSAVTGIEQARSPNHVLVSGMRSTAVYDLRAVKAVETPSIPEGKGSRKKRRAKVSTIQSSRPVINFHVPEERCSDFYCSGKTLAYIPYHDIAVVTTQRSRAIDSQTESLITLYDASTGRILPSPSMKAKFDRINGLVTGRIRDGPPSIFVSTPYCVQEWSIEVSKDATERLETGRDESLVINRDYLPLDARPGMASLWMSGDRGVD